MYSLILQTSCTSALQSLTCSTSHTPAARSYHRPCLCRLYNPGYVPPLRHPARFPRVHAYPIAAGHRRYPEPGGPDSDEDRPDADMGAGSSGAGQQGGPSRPTNSLLVWRLHQQRLGAG